MRSPRNGVCLVWRKVSVHSKSLPGETIVKEVSGSLLPGTLMALMGPSGAGKTSLMSALAFRSPSSTSVSGEILINGQPIGPRMYDISGFVYQDELFCPSITVQEHMLLMANLKLGSSVSTAHKEVLVEQLLNKTGLWQCTHTRLADVGNGKTLSGGEKKRLAFAVELLCRPDILFCDEPTTGLDSYSAIRLVEFMRDLTLEGTSVLCTIHQPSDGLFHMFNRVMLMCEGRTAFMGTPGAAVELFTSFNFTFASNRATAEFLLDCLSNRQNSPRGNTPTPAAICDAYLVSKAHTQQELITSSEQLLADYGYRSLGYTERSRPSWLCTVALLIKRNLLQFHRNPQLQYMKLFQRIVIAILVGLCFSNSTKQTQAGAQAVQGIIFLIVSENTFLPMYTVLGMFPETFPLFLRERKANLYSTTQFYLAQIIAMIPYTILESSTFILIVYYLAHLRPTMLALTCTAAASILVMNVSMACGCLFSTMFSSVPTAMSYLVPFDYILMITSGIFIRIRTIPSFLSWAPFVSWMMFGSEAISIAQWDGVKHLDCTGVPKRTCLRSGADVLEQFSFASQHLTLDFCALVGQYFIYHALALLCLIRRTASS